MWSLPRLVRRTASEDSPPWASWEGHIGSVPRGIETEADEIYALWGALETVASAPDR